MAASAKRIHDAEQSAREEKVRRAKQQVKRIFAKRQQRLQDRAASAFAARQRR